MSYVDATKEGIKWLENHGFYRNNIGQWMYPEKDRWTNLELGSIVEGSEDPNEDQPASPTRRLELTWGRLSCHRDLRRQQERLLLGYSQEVQEEQGQEEV